MEEDRHANDPTRHVNMVEIEDHLRNKLKLSTSEWQTLVATSVRVERYSREKSDEARRFVKQERAVRRENPLGPSTLPSERATLQKMQADLNTQVKGDVDGLKQAIGKGAVDHLEAYLNGPFAASTRAISLNPARLRAAQAAKEQAR